MWRAGILSTLKIQHEETDMQAHIKNLPALILPITIVLVTIGFIAISGCREKSSTTSVPQKLNIEMREWELKLSQTTIRAGEIMMAVTNKGEEIHEIAILKFGSGVKLPVEKLPVKENGAIDEDNIDFATVVGEIENVLPHSSATGYFVLDEGRYAIICNILEKEEDGTLEAHYAMGMRALLEVK